MLKKITLILCFFYFLFFNQLSLAAQQNDKNLLTFGTGIWDWNDEETGGLFNVEYRYGKRLGPFKPMIGGLINTDHGFHIYSGIRMDLYLTNKIIITPSFAPGLYERGDGKDLGHVIEFRSGLDLAYRRKNGARIAVEVHHLSNASLDENNPGTETFLFTYSIPLN